MVKTRKISFAGLPNCYVISNNTVELIVTTDAGPRILAYQHVGGENMLAVLPEDAGAETSLGFWHLRGGHRLWHAPEAKPRSYVPDDSPVDFETVEGGIHLRQQVEQATHIKKEMIVILDRKGSGVTVTHKLTNRGLWPVELAPWALTVVSGGGTTIFPNEPYSSHEESLLPARALVVWPYTDLSDPRFTFGSKFIHLRSDEKLDQPQKVGAMNKQGWAAYLRGKTLFVKRFPYITGACYPDFGCNFETFTRGSFMEVESLGPMVHLEPEQSTVHVEHWRLFADVDAGRTEKDLAKAILPLVESTV